MNVHGGATDVTTYFVLRSSTDGTELTGATITNIDLQYVRSGASPAAKVDATALAATNSAHGDNQAIEIDATDQPGLYRVDWPDAAFAAGVREVILSVKYTGAFTEHLRVSIDPPVNVEMWNGTDVPSEHTAGYPIVTIKDGTGTGEINTNGGAVVSVTTTDTLTTYTGNTPQTGDAFARIGATGSGLTSLSSQASVDDLPTNAELATALAAADDAILAQVALVKAKTDNLPTDPADQSLIIDATNALATLIGDVPTNAELATAVAPLALEATAQSILTDTAEIGAAGAGLTNINLPNQTMDIVGNITGNLSGSVGSVTGAVGSVTGAVGSVTGNVGGNVTGSVGSLAAQAKADVNAEVLDVLNVDTFAEPGQEAPAATTTLAKKIGYLFKLLRNRITQDSTTLKVYADDATTVDQKATVSDNGTTFDRGELGTGP